MTEQGSSSASADDLRPSGRIWINCVVLPRINSDKSHNQNLPPALLRHNMCERLRTLSDHVRVEPPAILRARLPQAPLECLRCTLPAEVRLPVVPPVDHMVARPCILQTQFPRHPATNLSVDRFVNN